MTKPICANGDFYVIASAESPRHFNVTNRHTMESAITWLPKAAAIECCKEIAELGLYGKTKEELSHSVGWLPSMKLIRGKYLALSDKPKEKTA